MMVISTAKYMKVFTNEAQMGIIIQILTFGSLNVKFLAKMINKSESTTLGHVKKLLEMNYLTLDVKETESHVGKFYRLTKIAMDDIKKLDNMDKKMLDAPIPKQIEWNKSIARMFQALSSWPGKIAYYTGVYMEDHAEELLKSNDPIKTDDKIFFINPKLSIKTPEEWKEFEEIMTDFKSKIHKFLDVDAPMTQYLSLISVPVPDIHPIEKKRHNPFNS